ncbi:aldehyde dehydrogenase [Thalassotalea euphylliae]|uniref:aldehyde dehydrogenase n=1 Tax=Thalassotalea euphylliae TaxID=1655234 RepID=UPI0036394D89
METLANFINGEFIAPQENSYLDNIEPATGAVYGQVPNSGEADLDLAISAAESALPLWRNMPAEQRADILYKLALLIEENLEPLAQAESQDNGKPLSLARMVDIPRAASNFKFFAQASSQFASQSHAMPGDAINYTLRQPIGIVGCISPWNLPLYLFTWKIAPALAAGNCVIAKPSEVTPKTAAMLGELCIQAGLPKGVLAILHGEGGNIGSLICNHPKVKAISFTGGSVTGAAIATQLAPTFKKLSLELGGKNPALVFADCDFDKTVDELVRASFANQGQICLCASRIYIERSIYEKFKAAFIAKVSMVSPSDPLDETSRMGAIVSQAQYNKVLSYIELAKEEGATVLTGGHSVDVEGRCQQGYFIAPTVVEGLPIEARCNQEEIFGPLVTLEAFDDDEQALALANGTNYGLASTLWTENINRAHRIAEQINTGIVWVNCWLHRDLRTPFGGMKASGLGREGGEEAMRFFTEPKNVCIKYND